jgi:ABC-type glycerol-3-phosphate transport system permease component
MAGTGGAVVSMRTARELAMSGEPVMAATIVVTLPLIVATLVLQRRILAGLTAGAVKG